MLQNKFYPGKHYSKYQGTRVPGQSPLQSHLYCKEIRGAAQMRSLCAKSFIIPRTRSVGEGGERERERERGGAGLCVNLLLGAALSLSLSSVTI